MSARIEKSMMKHFHDGLSYEINSRHRCIATTIVSYIYKERLGHRHGKDSLEEPETLLYMPNLLQAGEMAKGQLSIF